MHRCTPKRLFCDGFVVWVPYIVFSEGGEEDVQINEGSGISGFRFRVWVSGFVSAVVKWV